MDHNCRTKYVAGVGDDSKHTNVCTITFQSALVGDAIYCSNWYETSPKTRRLLLQCLMRAQVPVNIRVGFIEASMPTFRAVSFSIFFFHSVSEEDFGSVDDIGCCVGDVFRKFSRQ